MNLQQINKRIADMQRLFDKEASMALANDASYCTTKREYDDAVRSWLDNKSEELFNAMITHGENVSAIKDSVTKPIGSRYRARMARLHRNMLKLEKTI